MGWGHTMWKLNIKLYYPSLSKGQKIAADYMLEHEEDVGSITIRECAARANVGQPTILRMLECCGYHGWTEFQHQVWKENGKKEESGLHAPDGTAGRRKKESVVLQTIYDDMQMISDMAKLLDMDQIRQVVKIIKKAKLIDVYGTDNSANAAAELSGRFLHLGLTSRNYSDLFFQKISAGHLDKKDVAIGFSISGETTAVIDALSAAKKSGAVTIAVTGDEMSSLAKDADYIFLTPTIQLNKVSKWISTRISQIAFVDALCAALMESDMERFSKQLTKSTKEFEEDISERAR